MLPPSRKKTAENLQDKLLFLQILQDFYKQIVDSEKKLVVWQQVVNECKSYRLFYGDYTARYLERTKWPGFIRATREKWEAKKKELDATDILIIEIERIRKPDYCCKKNQEESMQNANVAEFNKPALDHQMADVVQSSNDDDVSVEEAALDNSVAVNPDDAQDEFNDSLDEAVDTFSSVTGHSFPMLHLPETANQPNNVLAPTTDLQNEFYRAGIEYFQMKSNMMRENLANSNKKNYCTIN
uniref:Uncharacterized protein n=1 Tax=Panagrolaimus davidi TaxID=227884 RepID=A0A914R5F8_9BILA